LNKERLKQKEHDQRPRSFFQNRLLEIMEKDSLATDLLLSLFVSVVNSYRKSSICEPFPDQFLNEFGEKKFEDLV
jgi:hypothetical protein